MFSSFGLVLLCVCVLVSAGLYRRYRPQIKGFFGELTVKGFLDQLPVDDYIVFHDIIVPKPPGTSQIDHMVVSRKGVFIVETKNYAGRIWGGEYERVWYQHFDNGSKRKFMNPLHQNFAHCKAIERLTGLDDCIHSVVAFTGCDLENRMPRNVLKAEHLVPYILSFQEDVLTDGQVVDAVGAAARGVRLDKGAAAEHVARVQALRR